MHNFLDDIIEKICSKFQPSTTFGFPGKNSNIFLRYRHFCEKKTPKSENVKFIQVKTVQMAQTSWFECTMIDYNFWEVFRVKHQVFWLLQQ